MHTPREASYSMKASMDAGIEINCSTLLVCTEGLQFNCKEVLHEQTEDCGSHRGMGI